jgi:hypothetical protein
LLVVGCAFANLVAAAAVPVALSGVCNILGDPRAVLVLHPEAAGQNVILAEGESAAGIKLLAVDMAASCVRIENGGQAQTLRLGNAPHFALLGEASGPGQYFLARGRDGMVGTPGADGVVAAILPGNPGWGTLPPLAGGNGAGTQPISSMTIAPPAAAGNASNVDPAIALKSPADTEWYQESLGIEQSRKDTAQQVLAGEMDAWPRTPLTPPGTPAALLGDGMFFSNHLPRYVVTGSLNQ